MILSGNFKTYNFYINYLLPAIFALALFLFSPKFKIFFDNSNSNLPFLNDVGAKKPSSGENFAALDGVRGLAALLVLGDHVGCPGLDGAGAVGVVVFFCLSGYLLSMSFAKSPSKISQVEYVKNYFSRRLMRILPMFYLICIVGYLFKGELGDFLRTVLFVQANGILWTVLQEIYFYLFLPFIIALNFYVFRGRLVMCVFFLLAITIAFNNGYIPTFQIFGNGTKMPLYIGVFLSGMVMCYVFHIPFVRESKVIKQIADNPLISIFCLFLLFSTQNLHHFLPSIPSNPIWLYRSNYCLLIGIILLFVTLSKDSILSRCLSIYPLRAIGIVGFSFYLLHPFIYQFYKTLTQQYLGVQHSGIGRFGLVLALTYLASTITYTYIERPFLKKTR